MPPRLVSASFVIFESQRDPESSDGTMKKRFCVLMQENHFHQFLMEREKINYFWIVEKKTLTEKQASLQALITSAVCHSAQRADASHPATF